MIKQEAQAAEGEGSRPPACPEAGAAAREEEVWLISDDEDSECAGTDHGDSMQHSEEHSDYGDESGAEAEAHQQQRDQRADAPEGGRAAGPALPLDQITWEAFPSLAWSRGKKPLYRPGLVHKKADAHWSVVARASSQSGAIEPLHVGTFSTLEHAARARDAAQVWRAVHGVKGASWASIKLCYPEAGYERDEQLLAALRAAPSGQDLRALLHNLIPPPARRPHGGNRRSRAGRAAQTQETLQGAGATAGAGRPAVVPQGGLPAGGHAVHAAAAADSQRLPCVSRRINRGVMEHSRLSVKGPDLRLLGWPGEGVKEEQPPSLVVSLKEPPPGQPAWELRLELGMFGRDGASFSSKSVRQLVTRLGLREGDTLFFLPLQGDGAAAGHNTLRALLSVTKQPRAAEQAPQGQPPHVEASAERAQQVWWKRRPQPADPSCEHAADLAGGAASPPQARLGSPPPRACANCSTLYTSRWLRDPRNRQEALCSACWQYHQKHAAVRPEHLWGRTPPKRRGTGQPEGHPPAQLQRTEEQGPQQQGQPQQAQQATGLQQEQQLLALTTPSRPAPPGAAAEDWTLEGPGAATGATPGTPAGQPSQGTWRAAPTVPLFGPLAADDSKGLAGPPPGSEVCAAEKGWAAVYAQLDGLLVESGVADEDAQDFKLALLGMDQEMRGVHFLEVQRRVAEGKPALVRRWVARVLGAGGQFEGH